MKILLFGATGNAGMAIAKELKQRGFITTAVIRNTTKQQGLALLTENSIIADVTKPSDLLNICVGYDIVISAMGKSVSPNDKGKPSFYDIDYISNMNILNEAIKNPVKKFIYISAFHSEKYLHLEYFKAHHEFSQKLISSTINYSIIKPPAIFSAFLDMIEMAKKGQLINIGLGDKKTNPIYEGDLAKIVVDSINKPNSIIEAGGKTIYTRKELNEIVLNRIDKTKKLKTIPIWFFRIMLPLIEIISKNTFDKFSFFIEVMQHDTIAPQIGNMTFDEYIGEKLASANKL